MEERQESNGFLGWIGRFLAGTAIVLFVLGLCNGYLSHSGAKTIPGWIFGCIGCGLDLLSDIFAKILQ